MSRHAGPPGARAPILLARSPFLPAAVAAPVLAAMLLAAVAALARAASPAVPAGPPYPEPVPNQAVYDQAGVFRPATIASVEATIDAIEERTGSEVVVYTQVKPESDTAELAQADADALGTQWGVGRKGFDDGLVILFDLDESLRHGQVQLDAGAGYAAAFLSNAERQQVYENDMLPLLKQGDLDGALLAAMRRIDAAATPEHAADLERGRQIDAIMGLIGAPIVFLGLAGWALWSWLRFGRDPVYLDDPSIHIPAPPPDLTPASGALVYDGHTSRRALTTAMLDLASRGLLTFREEKTGILGLGARKIGIDTTARTPADPQEAFRIEKAAGARLGPAEAYALEGIRDVADGGYVDHDRLLEFGAKVGTFDRTLEAHVVDRGWFRERPGAVRQRWLIRGGVAAAAGAAALFGGASLPSSGLVLIGVALVLAGIVLLAMAPAMPARTMPGAMIRAMLAAYRRTLEKTMAAARSMDQVVADAGLPWLQTPDQAVVWGVALGLQDRVEEVLERSWSDLGEGRVGTAYVPAWYLGAASSGGPGGGGPGGGGLLSSSAVPSFGGMMAALGTIGNSPSSSGGSGGGGLGGGGGFGGGGAGGGF